MTIVLAILAAAISIPLLYLAYLIWIVRKS